MLTVYTDAGILLDRQAVVKLSNENDHSVIWRTTQDKSVATFEDVPFGDYDVEVSAVGYLTAHDKLKADRRLHSYHLDVRVKPDPTAVELQAPITTQLPSKARKEINRAITDLKSGNLKSAQKRLEAVDRLVPSNSEVNFLLGYLFFQKKEFQPAQVHLDRAIAIDPGNVQALTLSGRLKIRNEDFAGARKILEQAVAADTGYWAAHFLLAETYLKLSELEKAREQAELAVEREKGGDGAAQIVLGEALANLGRDQDAIQALNTFLQDAPESPSASGVRGLIASLEQRDSNPNGVLNNSPAAGLTKGGASLAAIASESSAQEFSIPSWQPPGIDVVKPSVAANVTCPYEKVLDSVSERVKQLVDDVVRFSAIEDLLHEELDELGNPLTKINRKFNYIASISSNQPGYIAVDEYRTEKTGAEGFPDHIATRGLPTLAFVFHPDLRSDFRITCEGLGQLNGRATWLLHFRQRDDRPNRFHEFKVGDSSYPAYLKGRAWISAETFQIVRIESEMMSPIPQLHILNEHQTVEYGPVLFQKTNTELWLPKKAELYLDMNKRHYFRRHSFDHFMLFSVDSEGKAGEIKHKDTLPAPLTTGSQPR
jgi:tetratricopeptide (TPR) repeat protein